MLIDKLYRGTRDRELVAEFAIVESLHANIYHNFLSQEGFEVYREAVLKLMEKLRPLLAI